MQDYDCDKEDDDQPLRSPMGEIAPDEKDSLLLGDKLKSQTRYKDDSNLLREDDDKGLEEDFEVYEINDKSRVTITIEKSLTNKTGIQEETKELPA